MSTSARVLVILILGWLVLSPPSLEAARDPNTRHGVSKHRKGTISRKAHARKHRASRHRQTMAESLALLRKHLPEYEAAYDAESPLPRIPTTIGEESHAYPFSDLSLRFALMRNLVFWLGIPYVHGGWSRRGVDCSGFTSCLLTETLGRKFWGDPRWQARQFPKITSMDSLRFGDLIFFSGRNRRSARIGHVAVYLGNGLFAHSSSRQGVIVTPLAKGYYIERFRWGGRLDAKRYPVPALSMISPSNQ